MKKRKEEETRRKQQELVQHTRQAVDNYKFSREMNYNQLYSSTKGTANFDQTVIHNKP